MSFRVNLMHNMAKFMKECFNLIVCKQRWLFFCRFREITDHHTNRPLSTFQTTFLDSENSSVAVFPISWMQIKVEVTNYLLSFIISYTKLKDRHIQLNAKDMV